MEPRGVIQARLAFAVVVITVLGVSLGATRVDASTTPGISSAKTAPSFVGGQVCTGCHLGAAERWRGSHHDLAMETPSPATVRGRFDGATFTYEGIESTFTKRGDRYFIRTDGPDGVLRDYEVAYTFGVHPLQQYLVSFPGGRYQVPSIAWDARPATEGGQRWFHLYPDEKVTHADVLHWTGAAQNWNSMCADCHSTNLRKGYRLDADRYETTWTDIDVSCEACHGPASNHVSWARSGARDDDSARGLAVRFAAPAAQWIFEAGAATAHRSRPLATRSELEACAPCHARRSLLRAPAIQGVPLLESYRPALLEDGLYHADGQIDDEVYEYGSFLQSRMFHAGVTCSDCHDPHSLQLKAEGNALCAKCHAPVVFDTPSHHHHPPGSRGAKCAECHMPAKLYMIVDQRRDHSFRVPRPDLSAEIGVPNTCTTCHAERGAAWAAQTIQSWPGAHRWRAPHYGQAIAAGRRGDSDAADRLVRLVDDGSQPGIARGTGASLLSAYVGTPTLPALQRALRADDPLVRLGALDAVQSLDPAARPALLLPLLNDPLRAVRISAARAMAPVPAQRLEPAQRAEVERGLAEYREAQEAQADRPGPHLNLAVVALEQGRPEEAERELQTALRLGPQFVPAYVNLADLYRAQGRDPEAEKLLRRAVTIAPDESSVHHALGLLLVRQKRMDEALLELERAVDLDPGNVRHAYVLGVALNALGRREAALEVLRRAHERRPADRDLLLGLATISRDAGAVAEARAWAEKLVALAPRDPGARQLAQQLSDPH